MILEMEKSHKKVSVEQINECQIRLKAQFSNAYIDFLLSQNGGMPVNCLFKYDKHKESCVCYFYGIDLDAKDMDLENNIDAYRGRIPEGFLPIGEDPGGNIICIGGDNGETVYFWFHEAETEPPTMDNMYLIADTFQAFIDSLEPDEGEDW